MTDVNSKYRTLTSRGFATTKKNMPKEKKENKKFADISMIQIQLNNEIKSKAEKEQERKRAERTLKLVAQRLKEEGVTDYKMKMWTYM